MRFLYSVGNREDRQLGEGKCAQLISTILMPIGRINEAVGCHTERHFMHAFSQKVGISPGKFRNYPF
ncbi:MAG: hypothetical protein ACI3XY_05355 [Butyricicoccaceae bacterium]